MNMNREDFRPRNQLASFGVNGNYDFDTYAVSFRLRLDFLAN